MGRKTKPDTLTERAAMVRINERKPSDLQYDGLNTPLMHEVTKLALTLAIWTDAGYELLGQLAVKDESSLKAVLRTAHTKALHVEGSKPTAEERRLLTNAVDAQVTAGIAELKLVLAQYDLKAGLRVQHWDNLSAAA
jgi:hypothetical protein